VRKTSPLARSARPIPTPIERMDYLGALISGYNPKDDKSKAAFIRLL
jgi:hypothetical protein